MREDTMTENTNAPNFYDSYSQAIPWQGLLELAKADIFEYIEVFYNRQRRHSYLGYLSPADFEKKFAA